MASLLVLFMLFLLKPCLLSIIIHGKVLFMLILMLIMFYILLADLAIISGTFIVIGTFLCHVAGQVPQNLLFLMTNTWNQLKLTTALGPNLECFLKVKIVQSKGSNKLSELINFQLNSAPEVLTLRYAGQYITILTFYHNLHLREDLENSISLLHWPATLTQ